MQQFTYTMAAMYLQLQVCKFFGELLNCVLSDLEWETCLEIYGFFRTVC